LNPVRDRQEFARLLPVLLKYRPETLEEARSILHQLEQRAPAMLRAQLTPGEWQWQERDEAGRWTKYSYKRAGA
jgi:hypothetical protein